MKIITDNDSLAQICAQFKTSRYITIDTEFMRETTFWPKLCLIQMAMPDFEVLIDPLAEALDDLSPFFDLLRDKDTLKVMHGCRQDIEIFYKEADGLIPAPLMDTQVMAMVCGFGDAAGYETLVRKVAKETVDKGSRFTDWARRPLTDKQLTYALGDVTHLRVVFEELETQLAATGRAEWVTEEMATLTNPEIYAQRPEHAWKRMRMQDRRPHVMGTLIAVSAWREEKAQQRNIPRQRILKDEAVREIALQGPKDLATLEKLRSIPKGYAKSKQLNGLLDCIAIGLKTKKSDMPDLPKITENRPGIAPLVDLLKVLLKRCCEENNVAPKLVASVADLERIASDEKPDVKAMSGWRYEIFGQDALKLKNGQIGLACLDGKVTLINP